MFFTQKLNVAPRNDNFKIRNILLPFDQQNPFPVPCCFVPKKSIEASILFRGLQLLVFWPFGCLAYALLRHVDTPMLSMGHSLVVVVSLGSMAWMGKDEVPRGKMGWRWTNIGSSGGHASDLGRFANLRRFWALI